MSQLIENHIVKIQLTAAVSLLGFIIYWVYLGTMLVDKVEAHEITINEIKPEISKVKVIENEISNINRNIGKIEENIRTLINRK